MYLLCEAKVCLLQSLTHQFTHPSWGVCYFDIITWQAFWHATYFCDCSVPDSLWTSERAVGDGQSIFTIKNLVQKDSLCYIHIAIAWFAVILHYFWEGGCRHEITFTVTVGSRGRGLSTFPSTSQGHKCSTAAFKEELFWNLKLRMVCAGTSWESDEL